MEKQFEYTVVPVKLLALLEERIEVNMECYASDLAVDYMQAYYKVNPLHLCLRLSKGTHDANLFLQDLLLSRTLSADCMDAPARSLVHADKFYRLR